MMNMNRYTIHNVLTSNGVNYEIIDNLNECIIAVFYDYDLARCYATYMNIYN